MLTKPVTAAVPDEGKWCPVDTQMCFHISRDSRPPQMTRVNVMLLGYKHTRLWTKRRGLSETEGTNVGHGLRSLSPWSWELVTPNQVQHSVPFFRCGFLFSAFSRWRDVFWLQRWPLLVIVSPELDRGNLLASLTWPSLPYEHNCSSEYDGRYNDCRLAGSTVRPRP